MYVITTPNIDNSLYLYIISVADVDISVASSQHTQFYHSSSPQQGLQEGGILHWVVHLASQGGTLDNMKGEDDCKSLIHSIKHGQIKGKQTHINSGNALKSKNYYQVVYYFGQILFLNFDLLVVYYNTH
jgi:hypothetical protein